jgi:hypothetical protein
MNKNKIISEYFSNLAKKRDPKKLREHLKNISSKGVKARRRKAKKRA